MAIKFNNAVLEAVQQRYNEVLENTKNAKHVTIQTTYHYDEYPTIRYDVTEIIVPEDDKRELPCFGCFDEKQTKCAVICRDEACREATERREEEGE